jgi:hypothetical protein
MAGTILLYRNMLSVEMSKYAKPSLILILFWEISVGKDYYGSYKYLSIFMPLLLLFLFVLPE